MSSNSVISHHTSPAFHDADCTLVNFLKSYIIEQLKKYGYSQLASKIAINIQPPSDVAHKIVQKISNQLAEEKKEQLEDICFELQISKETLRDTFDAISNEMFHDSIKWGRLVTFIAFSGALAVYCAEHGLSDQVTNIMQWTDAFLQERLMKWIISNGGWNGFVKHFDDQEIDLSAYAPKFIIGMSMAALALAGGLFAYKRKLIS